MKKTKNCTRKGHKYFGGLGGKEGGLVYEVLQKK
jgi:hypothetical protein